MKNVNVEEKIQKLSNQFDKAQLNNDIEAIEKFFSPDAKIIGPRGFITPVDNWLNAHKSGDFKQSKLESNETEIHIYDGAVIIHDVKHSEGDYKGEKIILDTRVTEVWIKQKEKWLLTTVQYTPVTGQP